MAPDQYRFGVEIEIITEPHKIRSPLIPTDYYEKLAASLKVRGLKATANTSSTYQKHPDKHPERWWITRDGSLRPQPPEIAFEAVSPVLYTSGSWVRTIDTFWTAHQKVFHMPKRETQCGFHVHITPRSSGKWSLSELKDIAAGIIVYEAEVSAMLPYWRRTNGYCKPNSTLSTQLSNLSWDSNSKRREMSALLARVTSETELSRLMQANDRYVRWNFMHVRKSSDSGTIEFRGGRGLRGPVRTKRWIAFVVAFIDFVLLERLDSGNRNPSATSVEDLYSKMRVAVDGHRMQKYLPGDYLVLNESARSNDNEGSGFEPYEVTMPTFIFPKDAELPSYTTYPAAAQTRSPPPPMPFDFSYGAGSTPSYYSSGYTPQTYSPPRDSADLSGSHCASLLLRAAEFLWTILVGSIAGATIARYGSDWSVINYSVFLAVLGFLLLFPLTYYSAEGETHPILFLVECLNVFLWLAGAIAATVNRMLFPVNEYSEAVAVCAFLWLGVLSFGVSLIRSAVYFHRSDESIEEAWKSMFGG